MPLTPTVVLTATLQDFTGSLVGSAGNPARLRIALCGYGAAVPRIAGTATICKPGPMDIVSATGGISIALWGNDVITPSGTYYSITVLDGDENIVQCGMYQFTGTLTIDLSQATPIVQPPTAQLFSLTAQSCAGTTPGTVFTVPTPVYAGQLLGVFYRGLFYNSSNYTLVGQTLTMNFACTEAPIAFYVQGLA